MFLVKVTDFKNMLRT